MLAREHDWTYTGTCTEKDVLKFNKHHRLEDKTCICTTQWMMQSKQTFSCCHRNLSLCLCSQNWFYLIDARSLQETDAHIIFIHLLLEIYLSEVSVSRWLQTIGFVIEKVTILKQNYNLEKYSHKGYRMHAHIYLGICDIPNGLLST